MESEGVVPLDNKTFDPKMNKHSIDVYCLRESPPSRATLLLIRALGIKHTIKITNIMIGEHLTPEYLKMNPMHTIPTINDNDFILWDSNVIMKYLVGQYAKDDSLYPQDPKKSAIVDQRLYFNATYFSPRLIAYSVPVVVGGQQPDPENAAKFEEALGLLDDFLKDQTWVAGQYLTIADFSIVAAVATAEAVQFNISKYPNISAWYQRVKNVMASYGYQEVNQAGADSYGAIFKSKLK